ncbi:uncharacterized protein LOC105190081 [Harpegnathos saltator]|uniref:uncharacterized protein LOC105190081 n=1 Tax=Harpegnathos saltator TaxID=610380 RepID=UPI000DBED587|nr:uncharacterized protein LOC105190081 [Harpegnathos saltator]
MLQHRDLLTVKDNENFCYILAMSKNFYWTKCHKRTKPNLTEDKENIHQSENSKFVEGKSDMKKKRGLSAGAENRRDDVTCTAPMQQKLTIPRKEQFKIYRDEDERSLPLVRKRNRKEMRREEHFRFLTPTVSYR